MFTVFINASDSIYWKGSKYRFVDYDSFKEILNKLFINKIKENEEITIYYSSYISSLESCINAYKKEFSHLKIQSQGTGSTISFCRKHKMDGFILFENDYPSQTITKILKDDKEFRGIPKRIIYINEEGNIINYVTV